MSIVCSVSCLERLERVAQRGLVERRAGFDDQFLLRAASNFSGATSSAASAPGVPVARSAIASGSTARSSAPASVAGVLPAEAAAIFCALRRIELAVEPGEAPGQRRERVFVAAPESHAEQQLLERHARLAFERAGVGLVALAHAHGVDDDEVRLGAGSAPHTACRSVGREHARAAALHLLEVDAAADVAQEQQALRAA